MSATSAAQEFDREEGRPFDLPGGSDAALLIHGLTGSPFEVRYLAERLHQTGIRCLGPLLVGHGGPARVLAKTSRSEWLVQTREALHQLEGSRRTFVVGCSMGALLACVLAHEVPEAVDGLALLAPALRLTTPGRLAAALGRTRLGSLVIVPKRAGSDVHDPEMRQRNPCMDSVPLAAVAELEELASEVDRMLPGVAAPAIVVAGAQDHTVTLGGSRRMARRLGSGPAELLVLPESYHLVGIDQERDGCADAVLRFFNTIPVPRRGHRATESAEAS